jgi:ferredoxin
MDSAPKIYRKLQRRLDKLPIGFPATDSGVEIRILKHLFTPLEAEIAIELNFLPERCETIYKRTKKIVGTITQLEQQLDMMAEKGAIIRHTTRKGIQIYSLAVLVIGMFEFQVNKLTKEFYHDFIEYLDGPFRDEFFNKELPQLRPVPTQGSILPDFPILPYDDIRKIVSNLKGPILAANCICKQGQDLLGKPCKMTDMREVCIVLGNQAKNYHDLGWGKYISKEDLDTILEKAEKDCLVVQPSNFKYPFNICLCCGDCCEILTAAKKLENPASYFTANYFVEVDPAICIGCGICAKRCQMEAITIIDKKSHIDLSRCIGCGLCVPTCKPQAITLQVKEQTIEPPENMGEFYMNLMRQRFGNVKMLIMLTKRLFKMKVRI